MAANVKFNETTTSIYTEVADQQKTRPSANQLHGNGETSIVTTLHAADLFDHEVIGIGLTIEYLTKYIPKSHYLHPRHPS